MTTSVNKGERRSRLRETGMSHDCQVRPDNQKEYFRVNILFPGGQSVRGRNRPNIKRSLGVFIIVLRLLHFQASTIICEQLCQFFQDCFPPFCDLNFSPKNSYIHFRKISAFLPFTLNATEIMTFFEHNRNIIFKKRSIDLVKARCQESNTSRQSSSQFLLQLCLFLKEVRVHLP